MIGLHTVISRSTIQSSSLSDTIETRLPQPQRKQTHAAAANDFKEEDIVLLMEAQIMLSKVECALGMELS
eukprot:scaffold10995_cov115-Skeletonema_marinoi.AAC.1